MKKLLILTAVFFALVAIASELPKAKVKTLDGETVEISTQINTDGPTVISFWATWCKPCIKELNAFMDYYEDLQEETGVEVLAVSIDDSRASARVKPLVEGQGWEYTVLLDENSDLKRAMGIVNVPYTVVLNKDGEIVWQHSGYSPGDEEILAEVIEDVAAGKTPSH